MKNSFENPAYNDEDLKIGNQKELEEAKKAAGVKSHKEASADILEYARKSRDKMLEESVKENIVEQYTGSKLGGSAEKEISVEIKEKVKDWENFLKKRFPETQLDLSKLEIPKRTAEEEKEFTRLLLRTGKLELFKKCKELFPSVNHNSEDLDEFIAKNITEDSFIWVRDVEAADEKHKNKSGNMAEEEGLNAETIADRIMHELKYFDETGDHLDKQTGTLTSSRASGGFVLYAHWRDGKFHVHWGDPVLHNFHWRFRQVVSSPTKSEK